MASNAKTGPRCQAINLSDNLQCPKVATNVNELFCNLHAKQCYGLYRGYKRRNALLDDLDKQQPPFLRDSKTALVNQNFADVQDEDEVKDIHGFLFKKMNLLKQVIEARNKHHQHFYSQSMDYGHQAYLNHLQDQLRAVQKAMNALERRTAEILFKNEKWYDWVRTEQDEEEANQEKEAKRVKMEAALFRRHWQSTEARLKAARAKEEKKRQEAYLEQVWRERMAESEIEEDSDVDWDPIEDVFEDHREKFVDLIRHFLWMDMPDREPQEDVPALEPLEEGGAVVEADAVPNAPEPADAEDAAGAVEAINAAEGAEADAPETPDGTVAAPKKKKKNHRGGKKHKKKTTGNENGASSDGPLPDKSNIESKDEVSQRLREGVARDFSHVQGAMVVGTLQHPHETHERVAPLAEEDVKRLVSEITEVKAFLFCRQLLSYPSLLSAALKANSIEEFLAGKSLPESYLRSLCLKVESPGLQALRDACADFARGDEPDDDEEEEDVFKPQSAAQYLRHSMRYGDLEDFGDRPGMGLLLDLTEDNRHMLEGAGIATAKLKGEPKNRKMKIRICGKSIWNYASESRLPRDGWLHFSIMAKDCTFEEAMSLCRNWDEFYDLHLLSSWQYFPHAKWSTWSGGMLNEDLVTMGFVPFYDDMSGPSTTTVINLPEVTRRALDRERIVMECRNVVCGHMKRNDPISRRFIQYMLMRRGEALILVIDGKTGKIVVGPEQDERWLVRAVPGTMAPLPGEPARYPGPVPWHNIVEVGPEFFARVEQHRKWRFGFDSYYEVYVWHFVPGEEPSELYQLISEVIMKARRMRGMRDKYTHQKHITSGITRDKDTMGIRQLRPGEEGQSLYDELTDPRAGYWMRTKTGRMVRTTEDLPPGESPYLFYNDTDAAEDAVLFDEGLPDNFPFIEITNPVQMLENGGMPLSLLNYTANSLKKDLFRRLPKAEDDKLLADAVSEDSDVGWESEDSDDGPAPYQPGKEEFGFRVPPLWENAHRAISKSKVTPEQAELMRKLDFSSVKLKIATSDLRRFMGNQEIMERDRSYVFKDTFHLGDLEPGAQEKHATAAKLIRGIQKFVQDTPTLDWPWFCMEILDWLHLKLYYNRYPTEPLKPWPHRYMVQDITQAFVTMALFFPKLEVTSVVRDYLNTEEGSEFKSSPIFNQEARAKTLPDRRTRTSNRFRGPEFWNELNALYTTGKNIFDIYPWDWAMTTRPIIAKLYRAGALGPAPLQPRPEIVPGLAMANTEPHRPDKLDFFIKYDWTQDFMADMPANYIDYTEWPDLLSQARSFSALHGPKARFALIRLWSAPHFYPLMMMVERRQPMSFIDPVGRAWEWKFLPKDMPASEWSIHNTVRLRLGCLRQAIIGSAESGVSAFAAAAAKKASPDAGASSSTTSTPEGKKKSRQARRNEALRDKRVAEGKWKANEKWNYGVCELDQRVHHRGDLVLVMGTDEMDLLKWTTAVTFALQTKPWLREVDLWKSFVNVDLEFLEGLHEYWLGREVPGEGGEGEGVPVDDSCVDVKAGVVWDAAERKRRGI